MSEPRVRMEAFRSKADPAALATVDYFLAICTANPLEIGFTIDIKTIYRLFEIKEPFGCWRKRKLEHMKEFKDYVRNSGTYVLTPDSAMVVAMGNPGKVGATYSCYVSASVCDATQGKGVLEVFDEAFRYADEIERLERMED